MTVGENNCRRTKKARPERVGLSRTFSVIRGLLYGRTGTSDEVVFVDVDYFFRLVDM